MSNLTSPSVNRLSSLTIRQLIIEYEAIAETHFQEAAKWQPCIHAVAKYLLENERGRQNQEKADKFRAILTARRTRYAYRQRLLAKCLVAQQLAHVALERRTA
jgi:hypothetical protein